MLDGRPYGRAHFYMNGGTIRFNMGRNAGAVYMRGYSSFTMNANSAINHNHGYHAGGVLAGEHSQISMYSNSQIYNNVSSGSFYAAGGVVLTHSTSNLKLNNGQIIDNQQLHDYNNWGAGGVLVRRGSFQMYSGQIARNTSHMVWSAGGVKVVNGRFDMNHDSNISANTAHHGPSAGGVHISGDSNSLFVLHNGTISSNSGPIGGVRMSAGVMYMHEGNIRSNNNSGVYLCTSFGDTNTVFTMHGGEIRENTAQDTRGAGVHMSINNPTFNMEGGAIGFNRQYGGDTAFSGGGGVRVVSGIFNMIGRTGTNLDARIGGNDALGTHYTAGGGGIYQAGGRVNVYGG